MLQRCFKSLEKQGEKPEEGKLSVFEMDLVMKSWQEQSDVN